MEIYLNVGKKSLNNQRYALIEYMEKKPGTSYYMLKLPGYDWAFATGAWVSASRLDAISKLEIKDFKLAEVQKIEAAKKVIAGEGQNPDKLEDAYKSIVKLGILHDDGWKLCDKRRWSRKIWTEV